MSADIDWRSLAEPVARIVWGAPSVETKDELRWGARGSKRLIRAKGTWQDFETNQHGGAIDLRARLRSWAIRFCGVVDHNGLVE
jgi:hypothetical protein